jgi:pullulanase/glycogen debranching enzyme
MLKAAARAGAEERALMCRLALALPLLSQGVPFVHAGDDLLRSKSLDRDSYNSGDHFNRIDWTGQCNNFGVVRAGTGGFVGGSQGSGVARAGCKRLRAGARAW